MVHTGVFADKTTPDQKVARVKEAAAFEKAKTISTNWELARR